MDDDDDAHPFQAEYGSHPDSREWMNHMFPDGTSKRRRSKRDDVSDAKKRRQVEGCEAGVGKRSRRGKQRVGIRDEKMGMLRSETVQNGTLVAGGKGNGRGRGRPQRWRCWEEGCEQAGVYASASAAASLFSNPLRLQAATAGGGRAVEGLGHVRVDAGILALRNHSVEAGDARAVASVSSCSPGGGARQEGRAEVRCQLHKRAGDFDMRRPRCVAGGCMVRATYGARRGGRPIFCAVHRSKSTVHS